MTKALATIPSTEASVAHLRGYHQIAMNGAAQTACAAVMVGLELRKVQEKLKKSTTWTFDEWLEKQRDEIGFGRSTAFKYLALADTLKGKLLNAAERSVIGLLDKAPSDLSPAQTKNLLLAVRKSIDGKSLTDLYEDYEIVRAPRTIPLKLDPANNGAAHRTKVASSFLVQEQLFGRINQAGRMIEWWSKPIKVGNDKVPLWQTMPDHERSAFEQRLEITIRDYQQMLAQLKEAKGAKRK